MLDPLITMLHHTNNAWDWGPMDKTLTGMVRYVRVAHLQKNIRSGHPWDFYPYLELISAFQCDKHPGYPI